MLTLLLISWFIVPGCVNGSGACLNICAFIIEKWWFGVLRQFKGFVFDLEQKVLLRQLETWVFH